MSTIDFKSMATSKEIFDYFEKAGGVKNPYFLDSINYFENSTEETTDDSPPKTKDENNPNSNSLASLDTPLPKSATGISGFLQTGNLSNLLSCPSGKYDNVTINEHELQTRMNQLIDQGKLDEVQTMFDLLDDSDQHGLPSPYPGITNIGCSCYQNSIYQMLSCLAEIRNHICVANTTSFHSLVNYLNEEHDESVSIETIKQVLADLNIIDEAYQGGTQQDAEEFMTKLVNELHDYNKYFSYISNKVLICQACNTLKSDRWAASEIYQIAIDDPEKKDYTLQDMVIKDTSLQEPDEEAKSKCKVCNQNTCHSEKRTLKFPDTAHKQYLLLMIKRNISPRPKYIEKITVDTTLEIDDQRFELCAFAVHNGGAEGGHWIAYKKIGIQWVYCSDTITENIDDIKEVANLHLGSIYCYQKLLDTS
tara:strand:+ start:71 stop:1333 length:1263 start_codon:yes stop_codon:yes gene_type:complete